MNKISRSINSLTVPEKLGALVLILTHALAAYFSFGYHHPDEQFQIWEWANLIAGLSPSEKTMPWEWTAQIRPWFQPLLHAAFIKFFATIQFYNPFTLAFLTRALYAAFNIWAIFSLWNVVKTRLSLSGWWFFALASLWFFPYIHVRTSSENLAGIFLSFSFAYYLRTQKYFWTGILLGFAFLARYQIALGLLGFAGFLLWRDRKILKNHLVIAAGFLIPVFIGVLLDCIGYGNWVFTPYKYFTVNLVQGVAATYNPYPWYQYFLWIAQLNPFVSIPLFLGFVFYFKRPRLEPMGWFALSFFVLHFFISNKEYRFFFPILNLVPFLAIVGFKNLKKDFEPLLQKPKFLIPYLFMTLLAFSASALRGASPQTLWPLHAADRLRVADEVWLSNRNFVDGYYYYELKNFNLKVFQSAEGERALMQEHPSAKILVDGNLSDPVTQAFLKSLIEKNCELLSSSYPAWLYALKDQLTFVSRMAFQGVYQCR